MKRILLSVITIALVSTVAFGATRAFFTDTETNTGNTFSAGTIDISVDGQNPWTKTETLDVIDMKPSQHAYSEYLIQNVGTNPANVFKKIEVESEVDDMQSEPECIWTDGEYPAGTWDEGSKTCTGGYVPKDDISTTIWYDMTVWVYEKDPKTYPEEQPKWWQVIYTDEMEKSLKAVDKQNILLGMIPAGWYMKVQQSYHMDGDTGNWAQGDKLTFDITLTAEQLTNTVTLENKDFANASNPTIVYDSTYATLVYGVKDSKFNYTLTVYGKPDGAYTLIAWDDSTHDYTWDWNNRSEAVSLANITVLGSPSTISGSLDLGKDLKNAKVWLISGTYTPGSSPGLFAWEPTALFEIALMDYYDSGL